MDPTFVATLMSIKNIGGGIFTVTVNYTCRDYSLSLDRNYDVASDTYASTDDFVSFIKSETAGLNSGNIVLQRVTEMVGQRLA